MTAGGGAVGGITKSEADAIARVVGFPGGIATEELWEDLRSFRESFQWLIRPHDRGEPVRCERCGTLVALTPEALGFGGQWVPGIWEHETLRRHTMRRCEWRRENA